MPEGALLNLAADSASVASSCASSPDGFPGLRGVRRSDAGSSCRRPRVQQDDCPAPDYVLQALFKRHRGQSRGKLQGPELRGFLREAAEQCPGDFIIGDLLAGTLPTPEAFSCPELLSFMKDVRSQMDQNRVPPEFLWEEAARTQLIPLESDVRWALDAVVLAVTGYHAAITPLRVAKAITSSDDTGWNHAYVDIFLLCVSVLEIGLSFRTAGVDNGWTVDEPARAAQLYRESWFGLDSLSVIPFDLALLAAGQPTAASWAGLLHLLRTVKFRLLFRLSPRTFLEPAKVWFKVTYVPFITAAWWISAMVHWASTVVMITFHHDYSTSLYLVLQTISTVGYGDIAVETGMQKAVTCLLFIAAIFVNGYIASRLTQLVVQADVSEDQSRILRRTLALLRRFHVPREMQREVISYQNHSLSTDASRTYSEVTSSLPEGMQVQMSIYLRVHVIKKVPTFQNATPECQVSLAQALQQLFVSQGEAVCTQGDLGTEMYFLMHGCAEVHNRQGTHLAVLKSGSFFGHLALLDGSTRRTASVTAVTFCDMLCLAKAQFDSILSQFPEFAEAMKVVSDQDCTTPRGRPANHRCSHFSTMAIELPPPPPQPLPQLSATSPLDPPQRNRLSLSPKPAALPSFRMLTREDRCSSRLALAVAAAATPKQPRPARFSLGKIAIPISEDIVQQKQAETRGSSSVRSLNSTLSVSTAVCQRDDATAPPTDTAILKELTATRESISRLEAAHEFTRTVLEALAEKVGVEVPPAARENRGSVDVAVPPSPKGRHSLRGHSSRARLHRIPSSRRPPQLEGTGLEDLAATLPLRIECDSLLAQASEDGSPNGKGDAPTAT
eukprot:TRINITY_DN36350_c0_g1_i1.p1 TRINITY_DN36350_c0_g1~~TRINITY_DN36350_c0_g1_i1.p1  ORF type:complete len:840 (+),score=86.75 TRINITY_DN36350_c0_g1_i1:404-2923(+)